MLTRPLFIAVACYLFTLGATFNGVFLPDVSALTLPLMALLFLLWRWARTRGGWTWYRTPLDAAIFVWGGAIFLSLLVNMDDWRRIVIGMWYVFLYMLLWYVLTDLLSNNALKRTTLVDALLIAGVLVLGVGVWQLVTVVVNCWRYPGFFGLPRPGSLIGNPNSLAALLVVMIGFAGGRFLSVTGRIWRILLALYLLLTLAMLFLTYSRGGWIGGVAALGVVALLLAAKYGLFSPWRARTLFATQNRLVQGAVIGGGIVVVLTVLLISVVFLRSFNEAGRSADLRTYIWNTAFSLFGENSLVGHGLYTFGKGLERLNSMPPITPHSHAHSIPLNVMAELGVVGMIALVLSIVLGAGAMRANFHKVSEREQGTLIAGIAGLVGFGVHHLFDTPMMMPAIALAGLLALVVAVTPVQPVPMSLQWRRWGHGVVMGGLAVSLLISGGWSSRIYSTYYNILSEGVASEDYRRTAQRLQTVIDSDPAMPIYHWQQGFFYGLSAWSNDSTEDARAGIAAYERVLESEPQNAIVWTNVGALRWQVGEQASALEAFEQASDLAPRSWQLALIWGRHAESAGDTETAEIAYDRARTLDPTVQLLISPAETPLEEASDLYRVYASPDEAMIGYGAPTVSRYVIEAWDAMERGERGEAMEFLRRAEALSYSDDAPNLAWLRFGESVVNGTSLDPVRDFLWTDPFEADYEGGVNIARSQFLRDMLPRMFLPQVGYLVGDPRLIRLVEGQEG